MSLRVAALQARARRLEARAQAERGHESVDVAFEVVDCDLEVGGGIIAGALAYRLFIWLLLLALVVVGGLGVAADSASESPGEVADSVGLAGLVSDSVASAASGASGLASAARGYSFELGLPVTLLEVTPYAALWLLVSLRLPHRDARWPQLVPGALIVGGGVLLVNAVGAYVLGPYAINKQGTYGTLGLAAALLVALYAVSRLIVAGAVVNATLWDRRRSAQPPAA